MLRKIMTGFEYPAIANMINYGLLDEGFSALLAISDRYDGRIREGLDETIWGFSGNPFGDDEWGKWYFRAMSSYSILLATQGFIYDGPKDKIGFLPKWQPEDHQSFFTASQGWGVFSQKYLTDGMEAKIDVRYGQVDIQTIVLELENSDLDVIEVKVNESNDLTFDLDGNAITISLDQKISALASESIDILITTGTTVGTNETADLKRSLTIYPNPSKEYITVDFGDEFNTGSFSIFSSLGQLIDQGKMQSNTKFQYSTSHLSVGSYLIRHKNNNGQIQHGRFIVE